MILQEQMLHGCDYNPDQWLHDPRILAEDIALMKKANINCVSVGIFSWAALEPEEGKYSFDWLEDIIKNLYANGIYTILATPSGARPVWMAHRYPEVLRVAPNLQRDHMGGRHNHCYTSPLYREKVWEMNKRLAERLGSLPGVILWHLSNEYGGECYCPLCQQEFQVWLQKRYGTLERLNYEYWSAFWSHTYTDWSQIEPPLPNGETGTSALTLDWKRFVTHQTVDFCKWERDAVRAGGSDLPVTTNFMALYDGLNYAKFKDVLDVISWDSYPKWHLPSVSDIRCASDTAFGHDWMRCLHKDRKPFLLMESTPSSISWFDADKLKRPHMHMLSSMQAVAHGSNSVQYFQWRKSRGGSEKHHGAVVDHDGQDNTRVFKEVAELGQRLTTVSEIANTLVRPKTAILFDTENRWALQQTDGGPRNSGVHYIETLQDHYYAFWQLGIPVDVIDPACDLSDYKLVIAPVLYMQSETTSTKLKEFVEQGGTLVGTYWSGIVNESDLCYLGRRPHNLTDVFGLYREEIDALYDGESNSMTWNGQSYRLTELCERVKTEGAQVQAVYEKDFYQGEPALCQNNYGKGLAYYLAGKAEDRFYLDFYRRLTQETGIQPAVHAKLPSGVTATIRRGKQDVVFLQNFNAEKTEVQLLDSYTNLETGETIKGSIQMDGYSLLLLTQIS